MKSLLYLPVLLLCAGMLAAVPLPAQAASINIKIANAQGDTEPSVVAFREVFKPYVEEKSQGRMIVEVYTNSSLGNTNTVFQGLQFGTIQMMYDSTSNLTPFAPEMSIFDLPYMFPNVPSINRSFMTPEGQALFASLTKKNATVMSLSAASFRYLITSQPVASLDDVQGMKLRTTPSKSHINAITSLGMAATPMAGSEMLTGMQQGVVKGMDCDIPSIYSHKFYEVGPYFFASDHIPVCYILVASTRFLKKLSPEDRAIVEEGIKLWYDASSKMYVDYCRKAMDEMTQQHGCKLTVPSKEEKQRWIEKSKVAYDLLSDDMKKKAFALHKVSWGE